MMDKLIPFLRKYKSYFRLNDIESTMDIPQSTISRAIDGKRNLTDEQAAKIVTYFKGIRDGLDESKLFKK